MLDGLQQAGVKQVRFGLRQQLLIDAAKKDHKKIETSLIAGNVDYEVNKDYYPNISSSYPAAEIFIKNTWPSEGLYKDIFDQIEYKAQLKINIADCNPAAYFDNPPANGDNLFTDVTFKKSFISKLYLGTCNRKAGQK